MKKQPHLVLIMTDQHRGDCLGIAGHPDIHTPNLDYLAASGARFSRAYSECPVCIPARHTLMTGMAPDKTGCVGWVTNQRIADPTTTLPNLLRVAGYQTAMVGRGMHQYPGHRRYGFEHVSKQPRDDIYSRHDPRWYLSSKGSFANFPHNLGHGLGPNGSTAYPWHLPEEFHETNYNVNRAIQWLDQRDLDAPFFLSLGFTAPHPPFVPPAFFYDRYYRRSNLRAPAIGSWANRPRHDGIGINSDSSEQVLEGERLQEALSGYYGLVDHVDHQLNLFLSRLQVEKDREIYVLFTSDHGEMLGDHYRFRKSQPYEGAAHIPFLLSGPGIAPRAVCDQPVGLQDVLPTFCDLAGVDIPDHVTGRSVLEALRGEPWREYIALEMAPSGEIDGGFHALTDGKWKYTWLTRDGREQLFDLTRDPRELNDLSADPVHRTTFGVWRGRMIEHLRDRPEGFTDGQTLFADRPYSAAMPHADLDGPLRV